MRKVLTLSSLGLTLALSSAALAAPVDGFGHHESGSASDQNESNYWYKRFYGHKNDQARGNGSTGRLREGRALIPKTGSVGSAGAVEGSTRR